MKIHEKDFLKKPFENFWCHIQKQNYYFVVRCNLQACICEHQALSKNGITCFFSDFGPGKVKLDTEFQPAYLQFVLQDLGQFLQMDEAFLEFNKNFTFPVIRGNKSGHRMRRCLRQEGTYGHRLVQPLAQNRISYSRSLRAMSSHIFHISDDRDSTNSLGSVFQCLTAFRVKKKLRFFPYV